MFGKINAEDIVVGQREYALDRALKRMDEGAIRSIERIRDLEYSVSKLEELLGKKVTETKYSAYQDELESCQQTVHSLEIPAKFISKQ